MPAAPTRKRGRPKDASLTARRREDIIAAAGRIFAERGYSSTDVQVVADALEVGKGTIYRYFPSKRELFLAAVRQGLERLQKEVNEYAAQAHDPMDAQERAIRAYMAFFEKNPDVVELLVQERAEFADREQSVYFDQRDASMGPWREIYRLMIGEGRVRKIPIARVTDLISDILYGIVFSNRFAARQKKAAESRAADLIDLLLNGILTPAEQARRARKRGAAK